MFDRHETASLRGFDTAVADIGDQLHLRHPLLSLSGDSTLYMARRLNWRNDQSALIVADPTEASELATLLPDVYRWPIVSGEAVVVAGAGFVQAANDAGIQLDGPEMSFTRIRDSKCWISMATQASFAELQTRLAYAALTSFDDALGSSACEGHRLSECGDGALLVLRGCGTRWREDLAIRELASAKQNRDFDLYRRLLDGFEIELEAQPDSLHRQVGRHIELVSQRPGVPRIEQNREFDLYRRLFDRSTIEPDAQLDNLLRQVGHIKLEVLQRPAVPEEWVRLTRPYTVSKQQTYEPRTVTTLSKKMQLFDACGNFWKTQPAKRRTQLNGWNQRALVRRFPSEVAISGGEPAIGLHDKMARISLLNRRQYGNKYGALEKS